MAIRTINYKNNDFNINYEIQNPNNATDLIILHGWGSRKEIMRSSFKDSFNDFRTLYIDLPGFGKSSNDLILNTSDYKNIVELLLKELNFKKDIIMGHSFGGKVATLLNPKHLVLLSSAGIITKKPLSIRAKIKLFKLLKPFGSQKLRSLFASKDVDGMSENMYETFKNVVDEDFSEIFKNFKNKATIFWGIDDSATPLESGKKIASLIDNSTFYPLDGDHFFFLKNAKFIDQTIIKEQNSAK